MVVFVVSTLMYVECALSCLTLQAMVSLTRSSARVAEAAMRARDAVTDMATSAVKDPEMDAVPLGANGKVLAEVAAKVV